MFLQNFYIPSIVYGCITKEVFELGNKIDVKKAGDRPCRFCGLDHGKVDDKSELRLLKRDGSGFFHWFDCQVIKQSF